MEKNNQVRLWSARPAALCPAQWRGLSDLLDDNERRQAGRFRFAADQRAYVLAHGLRRLALAEWLQVPAASLCFMAAAGGQPHLLGAWRQPVFFSHSHTREAVLVALSADAVVGVDIESTRGPAMDAALLDSFIAPPEEAGADFYFYWTALEAYWKAAGTGLSAGQPRLHLARNAAGHWLAAPGPSITCTETTARTGTTPQPMQIVPLGAPPDCRASLALGTARGRQPQAACSAGWLMEERDFVRDGEALAGLA